MKEYLTCLKRKAHPQINVKVCIAMKCNHLKYHRTNIVNGIWGMSYSCNYKTRSQRKEKK